MNPLEGIYRYRPPVKENPRKPMNWVSRLKNPDFAMHRPRTAMEQFDFEMERERNREPTIRDRLIEEAEKIIDDINSYRMKSVNYRDPEGFKRSVRFALPVILGVDYNIDGSGLYVGLKDNWKPDFR